MCIWKFGLTCPTSPLTPQEFYNWGKWPDHGYIAGENGASFVCQRFGTYSYASAIPALRDLDDHFLLTLVPPPTELDAWTIESEYVSPNTPALNRTRTLDIISGWESYAPLTKYEDTSALVSVRERWSADGQGFFDRTSLHAFTANFVTAALRLSLSNTEVRINTGGGYHEWTFDDFSLARLPRNAAARWSLNGGGIGYSRVSVGTPPIGPGTGTATSLVQGITGNLLLRLTCDGYNFDWTDGGTFETDGSLTAMTYSGGSGFETGDPPEYQLWTP